MERKTIQSFTDLNAWKEGHILVLDIYEITKNFPKEELFGLVSQMRRCAVSITSNIAEGFSRMSYKEKAQFYAIALGSTSELQNQILIARDIKLIKEDTFEEIMAKATVVHKIIGGLIKASKNYSHNS